MEKGIRTAVPCPCKRIGSLLPIVVANGNATGVPVAETVAFIDVGFAVAILVTAQADQEPAQKSMKMKIKRAMIIFIMP
jgi:hypothetical protein